MRQLLAPVRNIIILNKGKTKSSWIKSCCVFHLQDFANNNNKAYNKRAIAVERSLKNPNKELLTAFNNPHSQGCLLGFSYCPVLIPFQEKYI